MTGENMDRERLILELGGIREKIDSLGDIVGDTGGFSKELEDLGGRVEQLIDGLKATDAPPADGPENRAILVVDDNDELREFVNQALTLSGYNVLDAASGAAAMALLKDMEQLDLIICDVILPGIKGPDLMRQIRDLYPNIKSIFMSGYVTEDIVHHDVEQILADGGVFLQKPFPTRKLLEAVYDMLGV